MFIVSIINDVGILLEKDVYALLSTFYPEWCHDAENGDPNPSTHEKFDNTDISMVEYNTSTVEGAYLLSLVYEHSNAEFNGSRCTV